MIPLPGMIVHHTGIVVLRIKSNQILRLINFQRFTTCSPSSKKKNKVVTRFPTKSSGTRKHALHPRCIHDAWKWWTVMNLNSQVLLDRLILCRLFVRKFKAAPY